MIYIDTGHHSSRSCDRRHCACLVNLQRSVLFTRVLHGERTPNYKQRKFQYFSHARMWTQCTPQKLDIVCAVSSLYPNNLAS